MVDMTHFVNDIQSLFQIKIMFKQRLKTNYILILLIFFLKQGFIFANDSVDLRVSIQESSEDSQPIQNTIAEGEVDNSIDQIADSDGVFEIDDSLMFKDSAKTLQDIFKNIPGVNGLGMGGRQTIRINVRGLEGFGRVHIDLDGAPFAELIEYDHGSASNNIWLDASLLKSAEVTTGASSSGAMAGKVSFRTIDPEDLLIGDTDFGGFYRVGGESNGRGKKASLGIATKPSQDWSFLAAITGTEYGNYDDGDHEEIVYSGNEQKGALLKGVYAPTDDSTLTLGYQKTKAEYNGVGGYAGGMLRYFDIGFEEIDTDHFTTRYQNSFKNDKLMNLDLFAYAYNQDRRQTDLTDEDSTRGNTDHYYASKGWGLDLFNTSELQTGNYVHYFTYGLEYADDKITSEEDAVNDTGKPGGETNEFGISLTGKHELGRYLEVNQGIRFDKFSVESVDGVKFDDDHASYHVGLTLYPFADSERFKTLGVFAKTGTGFRPPSLEELFDATYGSTNLNPEKSETHEIGFLNQLTKLFSDKDSLKVRFAFYQMNVKNIIDDDGTQYVNIGDDTLTGVEFQGRYNGDGFFVGITADWSDREEIGEGTAGDQIQKRPWSAFAELGKQFANGKLTLALEYQHVDGFGVEETNITSDSRLYDKFENFDPYDLYHFYARLQVSDHSSALIRVENLADETYMAYRTLDNGPGRSIIVSFKQRF